MVELLTDYSTQIYHALSTDARPDADPGAQLREIDTGKRFIFDGTSWQELPDGGGGGGGSMQIDNWLCVAGEFTTVSAAPTFSVPTGISNATLVAFLCKMTTPVEDAPAPSTYEKTYCYASSSFINKAVMWNTAQLGFAGFGIYPNNQQFTYWSNQGVNIDSAGTITIVNNHSNDTIVPAGVSYKWMAILEV